MKAIIGLGNPGRKYKKTRHNVGFRVVDRAAEKLGIDLKQKQFKSIMGEARASEKVVLMKPQTYMNVSGEAVKELVSFYKLEPASLLIVYDDLDLPPGRIRLRLKGGAGGHNGIKSVIQHLGERDFNRLRIGIGRPEPGTDVVGHVLTSFSPSEKGEMKQAVEQASDAVLDWLERPFSDVMNSYNHKES